MTTSPLRRALLGLLLVCAGAPAAAAQDAPKTPGFAREGAYIGLAAVPNFTLDGISFDGETGYREIGGTEIAILPKLDRGNLFKVVAGFRAQPAALEISYERRKHDATFLDFPIGAAFNSVNVDAKIFFLTSGRIQPHALVGIGFPWLTVEDGSATSEEEDALVGDAKFSGPALNLEGGVTFFATPRAGVSLGYNYRFIWFTNERGVGEKEFKLRPRFRERTNGVVVMGFFTF